MEKVKVNSGSLNYHLGKEVNGDDICKVRKHKSKF